MARNRPRKRPPLGEPPRYASRVYVALRREDVGLFRFLLEAEDNLAYMTIVDKWAAVAAVVYSPHQERAVRDYLDRMRGTVPLRIINFPARKDERPDRPERTTNGEKPQ